MSSASIVISTVTASKMTTARLLSLPAGSLVGVLGRTAMSTSLLEALAAAGVERRSVEVVNRLVGEGAGFMSTLTGWLAHLGPERALFERYRDEVAAGGVLLVIRNLPASAQAAAAEILRASGARCVTAYGRFTIRTIAP